MSCEAKILINALKQSNQLLKDVLEKESLHEVQKLHIKQRIEINHYTLRMAPTEREVEDAAY